MGIVVAEEGNGDHLELITTTSGGLEEGGALSPHHLDLGGREGKEQEELESPRGRSNFSITLGSL